MYPSPEELLTESDVEQKLLWQLLTNASPNGMGFSPSDLLTKLNIRRLEIGKGSSKKIYYPDYIAVLAGIPVLIVEAKAVGESVEDGLVEARLYANEINALHPHQINPCLRVISCNGESLLSAPTDSAEPDIRVSNKDFHSAAIEFAKLLACCSRLSFQAQVNAIRSRLRPSSFRRAVSLVGGSSFQNEELPQNTFGATIVGDYGHIFNPESIEDRAKIVREAYIPSLRQQRYIEPIDRLVRNAVAPVASSIKPIENSAKPIELTNVLRHRRKLESQIMLLIGSVGAGKSTFVDYLSVVALPPDIRARTVWLRLNLNNAPVELQTAYAWVATTVAEQIRIVTPQTDFDDVATLLKVFYNEITSLKKGPLALLDPTSNDYRLRLADRLSQLQQNPLASAKGMANFVCAGPDALLVVVLDNCDKRTRDEQLTMFQVAQWIQAEFRCLVVLPLRDVTFDMHRNDPPLDTALKQFVFRIEPPPFSDVLQARVRLALEEITRTSATASSLSYLLPNGLRVTYPAKDQALYLASLLRSLYAHDRFVRQVMAGLAGRDVRRALEIFLDFCMSGHIGEDEILKIRLFKGQHVLPLSVVARVLLRMQRRFYDGNRSYLKNILQCDPSDPLPDHFVRLAILRWLERRLKKNGPAGVEGFHRASDLISELAIIGHDASRVRLDLSYLAREGCVIPEHLRLEKIEDDDLLKISAAGVVHLQLLTNPEYLAACSEDTFISDNELTKRIAGRISESFDLQFAPLTTALNSTEFVTYLKSAAAHSTSAADLVLEESAALESKALLESESEISAADVELSDRVFVGGLPSSISEADLLETLASAGLAVRKLTMPRQNGQNRGFAFAEFQDKRDVLQALQLNGMLLVGGRRVRINEAHPMDDNRLEGKVIDRAVPELSTRIYLGNLPYDCDIGDIRALLAQNDLTAIDIFPIQDRRTQHFTGASFVEFGSLDDASRAIGALDGTDFSGRRLFSRPAEARTGPRSRGSTNKRS